MVTETLGGQSPRDDVGGEGPGGTQQVVRPPLSRQVGWTLAGNLGYALAQATLLTIMAKTLPPLMLGKFGLGLAIATPILTLTSLQLRSLQATNATSLDFDDFLGIRLLSVGVALLLVAMVILGGGYPAATALVIAVVAMGKGAESVTDTLYGQMQRAERMRSISVSMLSRGFLGVVLAGSVLFLTRDIRWGLTALALVPVVVMLSFDIREASRLPGPCGRRRQLRLRPRVNRGALATSCRLGVPLGISSVLLSLVLATPRYLLERLGGEENLGVFIALAYPSVAFGLVTTAFGQAASPRLAQYYSSARGRFRLIVVLLCGVPLALVFPAVPALIIAGPKTLELIYGRVYAAHFDVFLILLAAGVVGSVGSALGYAATSSGRILSQTPAAAVTLLGTIAAGSVLIPTHGLMGAALTSLVSATLMLLAGAGVLCTLPDRRGVRVEPLRVDPSRA